MTNYEIKEMLEKIRIDNNKLDTKLDVMMGILKDVIAKNKETDKQLVARLEVVEDRLEKLIDRVKLIEDKKNVK